MPDVLTTPVAAQWKPLQASVTVISGTVRLAPQPVAGVARALTARVTISRTTTSPAVGQFLPETAGLRVHMPPTPTHGQWVSIPTAVGLVSGTGFPGLQPTRGTWRTPAATVVFLFPAPARMQAQTLAAAMRLFAAQVPAMGAWRTPAASIQVLGQARILPDLTRELARIASGLPVEDPTILTMSVIQSAHFLAADWLLQCAAAGLKLSYQYNPDGTWEHRIASLGTVDISTDPGGGIGTVGNLVVQIYEDGAGQSLLQRWNATHLLEGQHITLHILLAGDTTPLQIFDGHIQEVTIGGTAGVAVSQITAVDDTLKRNILLPKTLVTQTNYPNASDGALTQAIPLVYGGGDVINLFDGSSLIAPAAPLLLVDTVTNTYLAATNPMYVVGSSFALYDTGTKTYHPHTGDASATNSLALLALSGALQSLKFGAEIGTLIVGSSLGASAPGLAIDGNPSTIVTLSTSAINTSSLYGWGVLDIFASFTSAFAGTNTLGISAVQHRRGVSSLTTVTGQFIVRTVNANGSVLRDNLFQSELFRQALSPLDSVFTLTALTLGNTERLGVRIIARNEGGAGGALDYFQLGDVSIQGYLAPAGNDLPLMLYDTWRGGMDRNGQLTGTAGTLLRFPSDVLGDILSFEIDQALSVPDFQAARAYYLSIGVRFDGGIGAGWGIDRSEARTVLNSLSKQAMANCYPDFTGAWTILPYKLEQPPSPILALTQEHVLYSFGAETAPPNQRQSTLLVTLGKLDLVAHRFEVHFAWNPGSQKYSQVLITDENGSNSPGADAQELFALCLNSSNRYGVLPPNVLEAPLVTDAFTASKIMSHRVNYFWSQRLFIEFEVPLQLVLQLRLGTYFTFTHPYLPTLDQGGSFEVHRLLFIPAQGRVRITASKLATTATGFEYFALRDVDNVIWYFWIDIAGQLTRDTTPPSFPPLTAISIVLDPIPYWFLTTDSLGGVWYLFPDTLGQLSIDISAPVGAGAGAIVGTGQQCLAQNGQTYRLIAEPWQEWALDPLFVLTPP